MKRTVIMVLSLLLVIAFLAACAPAAPAPQAPAPAPVPAAPAPAPQVAAPAVKGPAQPAWQEEWDKLVAATKREDTFTMAATIGNSVRTAVSERFKKSFGISTETILGRGSQIAAKVASERRAGIYAYDMYIGGTNTLISSLKPKGFFVPLEPVFILPELTDPEIMKKTWWQGQPFWIDKEHYTLAITITTDWGIAVNTDLVKSGEFTSWRDLLNPKWQGKVGIPDPTTAGAGGVWFTAMYNVMGEEYLKELATTKPIIVRDDRLVMEWLAHGKLAMLCSPDDETLKDFLKVGAPIQSVRPKEGTWVSSGASGLAMFDKAPHPNVAKLFVNWILSKEGSETFAVPSYAQAVRLDVTTEHLHPNQVRKSGATDFMKDREEELLKSNWYQDLAKKIFPYAAQ